MDDKVKLIGAIVLFIVFAISILIRIVVNEGIGAVIFTIIPIVCILLFMGMVWKLNKENKNEDLFN